MYVEPTWIELCLYGTITILFFIIIALVISYFLSKILFNPICKKFDFRQENMDPFDKKLVQGAILFVIFLFLLVPAGYMSSYTWNMAMEQPSVRTDTVTIASIQPRPGAVDMSEQGYYIDNADQLMFVTTDGREFKNTENWMFNKFETRTIFNKLKVNGTYVIKYYGWRNGQNNEFPNILSVEKVISEDNATTNEYNQYFGANRGNRAYDVEMYNEYGD